MVLKSGTLNALLKSILIPVFIMFFSPSLSFSATIWPPSQLPGTFDAGPETPVQLGVKFRSDTDGMVTGIRFYKSAANSGTHVGSLWTASGLRLASATCTNETASGWQQVDFDQPVAVSANTVYIAAYHTTVGHYSFDKNYFAGTGKDNPPLHALADGISGGNGVFAYGSSGVFPDQSWSSANYWVDVIFSSQSVPPPDQSSGKPILLLSSSGNPFSRYYTEILRTEGFNSYDERDIADLSTDLLASYDVVLLGKVPLTSSQADTLAAWVNSGGNLIAMRPDAKLANLLGLTSLGTAISDSYLKVNTGSGAGVGITGEVIQYHGVADLYNLEGASAVAMLYENPWNTTGNPAVTLRRVGSNGGQAAAFTYDLARSVVYTRQGNPAWAGQARDGNLPMRSDDLFFGNALFDPQPDWVNMNMVAIPQADEQQRLLANLIIRMNMDKKPLPRFWYFPRSLPAVVVMTGDDHGNWNGTGATAARFDEYISKSDPGCSVDNWECIRGTSYVYPNVMMTSQQASYYNDAGFEVALHLNTDCADWTPATLRNFLDMQLVQWQQKYSGLPLPATNRTHCVVWSDYSTLPSVEQNFGIRLDTTYYYWPGSWIRNSPGFFTGSGIPMRFTDAGGNLIDVYQAATQMTDESEQSYPFTIDSLLDRATGPEGYYGAFVANMHTDEPTSTGSNAIINSAKARGIPVISARQLLTWLDGKNRSAFSAFSWNGNRLRFLINVGQGANGLTVMVPAIEGKSVNQVSNNGNSVYFWTATVKGVRYEVFEAKNGTCEMTYSSGADTTAPTVTVFTIPATSTSLTVPVGSFTATDNIAVSGYLLTESSTAPSASASGWSATAPASYTFAAVGNKTLYAWAKDAAGNVSAGKSASVVVTVISSTTSIWSVATVPGITDFGPDYPVELGMKFKSDTSGYITGIRFYKASDNTGTHVGNLWSSSGSRLATATFDNESASGWQQVNFSSPVAINANTVYVASYHTNVGHFSVDHDFFTGSIDNPPLHALANGVSGGNGVFAYGSASAFPDQSWSSSNYWVDVIFGSGTQSDTVAPTVTVFTIPATSTSLTVPVGSFTATDNIAVSGYLLTESSTAPSASASGWSATAPASYTFAAVGNKTLYAWAKDAAGNVSASKSASVVVTVSSSDSTSIWSAATVPGITDFGPDYPVELGVKFKSDTSGYITGIRFYKASANTGTHVGNLWSGSGSRLATATFEGESASGWQQVNFSTPVAINANTVYVASYHTNVGHFSVDRNFFTGSIDNPPLHALSESASGGNGVFAYSSDSAFPDQSWSSSNYWVDVVFSSDTPSDPPASGGTSIWPAATVPGITDFGPDYPVELGVKFKSDTSGYITGIRFYKASANTGTHVGNLWSGSGSRLATATFEGESASGWQQVNFSTPVAISANTVYVASYHTSVGHFSVDRDFFAGRSIDNPPLHALSGGASGGNGVFAYSSDSAFPDQSWSSSNYWVDVVFSTVIP